MNNPFSKVHIAYAYRGLLEALRDHTSIRNVSMCFPYRFGFTWPELASQRFATGQYRLYKCSNTNACVVCGGKNASVTQHQLRRSLDGYLRKDSTIWLMTLELGFGNGVTARKRYRALSRLFGSLLNQSPVKRMRKKWNVAYFKALEETLIKQIWTPHFHLVWVFPSETPSQVISEFIDLISVKWRYLASKEQVVADHERAVWAQELDYERGAGTIARYLTKAFYWNVAQITERPAKTKPLDFAILFAKTADLDALDVWNAYEQASNGAHRFRFSKNWNFSEELP